MTLRRRSTLIIIFHCVKEKTLPSKHEFTAELLAFHPLAVSEDKGDGSPQRRSFGMAVGRGEAAEGAQRWEAVVLFAFGAECSSSWLGTGQGYVPQIWTLTLFASRVSDYSSLFNMLISEMCACLEDP